MLNYSEGKIYKIVCDITNKIYYGSTTMDLAARLYLHKNRKNRVVYKEMKEPIICLLEYFPCKVKYELLKKEGEFILNHSDRNYSLVNKNVAGRTRTEWRSQPHQREKEKALAKKYYQKNKEKLKEKTVCECGSSFRKDSLKRHNQSKKHIKYINQQKNI